MSEEEQAVRFSAQVFKVQTLQTGGGRLTLDFWDLSLMAKFAEAQQPGIVLECAAIAINKEKENKHGMGKRSVWKQEGTP